MRVSSKSPSIACKFELPVPLALRPPAYPLTRLPIVSFGMELRPTGGTVEHDEQDSTAGRSRDRPLQAVGHDSKGVSARTDSPKHSGNQRHENRQWDSYSRPRYPYIDNVRAFTN